MITLTLISRSRLCTDLAHNYDVISVRQISHWKLEMAPI